MVRQDTHLSRLSRYIDLNAIDTSVSVSSQTREAGPITEESTCWDVHIGGFVDGLYSEDSLATLHLKASARHPQELYQSLCQVEGGLRGRENVPDEVELGSI